MTEDDEVAIIYHQKQLDLCSINVKKTLTAQSPTTTRKPSFFTRTQKKEKKTLQVESRMQLSTLHFLSCFIKKYTTF